MAQEKGDAPAEAEPGICRFECDVCMCSCQVTFDESKRHTIAKGLSKNAIKGGKNVSEKSREARNAEGRSLFFDYVKSNLHDNSIREYQGFDSRSNNDVSNDILVTTANDIYLNDSLQSDAHVMRGLQDIIPGRRTTVSVTPAGGGNKVNVSLQQLKKELKGGNVYHVAGLLVLEREVSLVSKERLV